VVGCLGWFNFNFNLARWGEIVWSADFCLNLENWWLSAIRHLR
jgi:hypothetical protein